MDNKYKKTIKVYEKLGKKYTKGIFKAVAIELPGFLL